VRKLWIGAALAIAVLAFVVAVATAGRGGSKELRAELSGYQEVPAVSTAAQGSFSGKIRNGTIEFKLSYSGLEAPVRFAHIHFAQEDVNGGIAAFLCGGEKPPCPQSGEVRGTVTADDVVGPADQGIAPREIDELVRAMRNGLTYANVHSEKFPNGEIRGQIGDDEDEDGDDHRGNGRDDDERENGGRDDGEGRDDD
jgi:hypothetical protein